MSLPWIVTRCGFAWLLLSLGTSVLTAAEPEVRVLKSDTFLSSVALSPDGKTVFAGGHPNPLGTGRVFRWDTKTGKALETITLQHSSVSALTLSPDGRTLVTSGSNPVPMNSVPGLLELFDAATGKVLEGLKDRPSWHAPILSLAYAPDGKHLALGGHHALFLWDMMQQKLGTDLKYESGVVAALAYAPDGQRLATAGYRFGQVNDKAVVQLWTLADGKEQRFLTLERGQVTAVAFSPDGKLLAAVVAFEKKSLLKLWDAASGKEQATLEQDGTYLTAAGFAPDGKTLATAGSDGTIKLWDVATARERQSLRGHTGKVLALAFPREGSLFTSLGEDKTVRIWHWGKP